MTLSSTWTLWTVRPANDYEILRQTGVFITDPQYIDPDHLTAYLAFSTACQKVPATCCGHNLSCVGAAYRS
ncbi:MAG: hypothetical protein Q4A69_05125 [Moraxella sp.]|nr:hypothetical protein [Moraxella sp.]